MYNLTYFTLVFIKKIKRENIFKIFLFDHDENFFPSKIFLLLR